MVERMRKLRLVKLLRRWSLLALIILGLACVIYFRLYEYLNYQNLTNYHHLLLSWTKAHYLSTVLSYIFIYILIITLSIPGNFFMTLTGGLIFGPIAIIYVVLSATIGSTLIFMAIRTAVGEWLAKKVRGSIKKFEKGFQQDAFNYLLMLRLLPFFPFWMVNICAALLNVRLRTFITATFIGIIPGALVYVLLGNSFNTLLNSKQTPNFNILFSPAIFIPLCGLAILAVFPVIYKRYRK